MTNASGPGMLRVHMSQGQSLAVCWKIRMIFCQLMRGCLPYLHLKGVKITNTWLPSNGQNPLRSALRHLLWNAGNSLSKHSQRLTCRRGISGRSERTGDQVRHGLKAFRIRWMLLCLQPLRIYWSKPWTKCINIPHEYDDVMKGSLGRDS